MKPSLFVDPESNAARQAALWKDSDALGAKYMAYLASLPQAVWLGPEWVKDPAKTVSDLLDVDGVRTLVLYAIPGRDGDAFSKGGCKDPAEYLRFVDAIAASIKARGCDPFVVIEPDALAMAIGDGMPRDKAATRFGLIGEAVRRLGQVGARAFVDAGDSNWIDASRMGDALKASGIDAARGVALNVSHNEITANELAYADKLRAVLGRSLRCLIDTSRNGAGPYVREPGEGSSITWCNAPETAIGVAPKLKTGIIGFAARLHVKRIGESDGTEQGPYQTIDGKWRRASAPDPGKWMPEYAREQVDRAVRAGVITL